jgi:HK97 family phage portal protein
VYSCIKVLSEGIASLPISVYRRLPDGGKEEATDHPLYNLLKYQPNSIQTKFNFVQMMTGHLGLRGNFYAEMVVGPNGQVQELVPLHPGRITTEILTNRELRFRYWDESGKEKLYRQGDLFRVHNLSSDGIKGISVIEQVRDTFGSAQQTQEYASRFFANDAKPGGILKAAQPMDDKIRQANREAWEKAHRGAKNAHKVAILYGLDWQSVGMTNEDSQFLETRKFTRSEICGLFGVPPHMIGDLERATFSNIEHQDIAFYKHTIRPWLVNIEQSIKRDLILEDDVFAEFNADGLLRGDAKTRSEVYASALGSGGHQPYMTVNEVRAKENLNPIEGGDVLPERAGQNENKGNDDGSTD